MESILNELFMHADEGYRDFTAGLMPTVDKRCIIGVRVPEIRRIAKARVSERERFFAELPHKYHEENMLHTFFISGIGDADECLREIERFLPFIDNWAVCDSLRPRCFAKNKEPLLIKIKEWLESSHPYTVRLGVQMLMVHFLKNDFSSEYLEMVASLRSEEYYVRMMIAWYFATALSVRYEQALVYIEGHRLDRWTHNKTISKARESFAIGESQKEYLKKLRY